MVNRVDDHLANGGQQMIAGQEVRVGKLKVQEADPFPLAGGRFFRYASMLVTTAEAKFETAMMLPTIAPHISMVESRRFCIRSTSSFFLTKFVSSMHQSQTKTI
jgi:hypothetical protein